MPLILIPILSSFCFESQSLVEVVKSSLLLLSALSLHVSFNDGNFYSVYATVPFKHLSVTVYLLASYIRFLLLLCYNIDCSDSCHLVSCPFDSQLLDDFDSGSYPLLLTSFPPHQLLSDDDVEGFATLKSEDFDVRPFIQLCTVSHLSQGTTWLKEIDLSLDSRIFCGLTSTCLLNHLRILDRFG